MIRIYQLEEDSDNVENNVVTLADIESHSNGMEEADEEMTAKINLDNVANVKKRRVWINPLFRILSFA